MASGASGASGASALNLENYKEYMDNITNEIQQKFTLIGDINLIAQEHIRKIDKLEINFMSNVKISSADKKKKTQSDIQHHYNIARKYRDESVQLAVNSVKYVEKQMSELDSEIARLEIQIYDKVAKNKEESLQKRRAEKTKNEEIKKEKASNEKKTAPNKTSKKKRNRKGNLKKSSTAPSEKTVVSVVAETGPLTGALASVGVANKTSKKKRNRKGNLKKSSTAPSEKTVVSVVEETGLLTGALAGVGVAKSPEELGMLVNPNEKTYCLCNQIAYDKMIACDNPDCPFEWFHFECVKVTTEPRGKWFCPKCLTKKK
ncbi:inhibitor of growth protein 5-like isoform X2 [Melanaphis sacchari]|uniref:inhibitor of growth protein 5-like isoform X2 n=1 Tax=Melanaphis sacchari TaxID=742174 RepID=UPI000DC130FF|nr:inhibitor of growth protein 5-like isoform X2 [Melanaphis sacchari]